MSDKLGFTPDDWVPPPDEPVLEVPPSFTNGPAAPLYEGKPKKRGRRKVAEVQAEAPSQPVSKSVNQHEWKMAVVVGMSFLSKFVDESFNPLDANGNPQPRINEACNEMYPLVERYSGWMIGAMPYIAFVSGCITLVAPAIDPVTEIIAGVRKPRFARNHPGDVYTEEYIAAVKRHNAKQAAQQNEQSPSSAASPQTEQPIPNGPASTQTVTLRESDFHVGAEGYKGG
jgi:hypothetical protein